MRQGQLLGGLLTLGFDLNVEAQLDAVTLEIVKTSEIAGEVLKTDQVRSSVVRHLGVDNHNMPAASREIDAVVEMMLDATFHYQKPLLLEDLLGWHRAQFPEGYDRERVLVIPSRNLLDSFIVKFGSGR